MSQHDQHWDGAQTLRGFGQFAESPTFSGGGKARFIQIGARVSQTGQLFETNAGPGSGPMVIKLLAWGFRFEERVVHDFTREAMTVANLRHPHIVQVTDAGTLPDGTPFIVMERLRGETLEKTADRGPIPTLELLAILRGLASGLSAAHAAGVVHGDLRADNVFMADVAGYGRGFPKLLDFGVARLTAAARTQGHVAYQPPAEARPWDRLPGLASGADELSDQLALAALTSQLLTGTDHGFFEARGFAFERADTEVGRPRLLLASSATSDAHRVLSRAMSENPAQRFNSVTSFLHALEEALLAAGPPPAVILAPPRPAAPEPASLTQQFFDDGERQDIAHSQGTGRDGEEEEDDDSGAEEIAALSGTFDRVPRNRTRMIGVLSLALASAILMGWTVLALSRARGSAGPLSTEPPSRVVAPQLKASPPTTARVRVAVRRARVASASGSPRPSRTEPPPVAQMSGSPPAASTATALPHAMATSAPVADPSPAAATPAPLTDEDFTQPWEQTAGEPTEAPRASEGPPASEAPPASEGPPAPAAPPASAAP
jgi:eukaryotic-like serine/threonine-protein kinase